MSFCKFLFSGCLAGRAYPKGDIPKNYAKAVKINVWNYNDILYEEYSITHNIIVSLQVYKTLLAKRNEHDTSGMSLHCIYYHTTDVTVGRPVQLSFPAHFTSL